MSRRDPGRAGSRRKVGLALAGGGFLGAAYELGALAALAEAIDGLDLTDLDSYVGVSAGSFIAAGLANGMNPHQMVRMFIDGDDAATRFDPATLLAPDYAAWWTAATGIPGALARLARNVARERRFDPRTLLWAAIERAGSTLPIGLVNAAQAQSRLANVLQQPGRSDNFREIRGTLRIVATDIDTGASVEFGSPGHDDVPISRAVLASCAVPGLFSPVKIGDRFFVDGALTKTLHASVALDQGAELVICVNPLVPYSVLDSNRVHRPARSTLPTLLSQSIRTAIRSRMTTGLEKYKATHPRATIVLFEPNRHDARVFLTSMFSLTSRRQLCEHAYQQVRADLRARAPALDRSLRRFGMSVNRGVVNDTSLRLVAEPLPEASSPHTGLDPTLARLTRTLTSLERALHVGRLA